MCSEDFEAATTSMNRINAYEQLMAISASTYPHMKEQDRNKIHRNLSVESKPPIAFEEAEAFLMDDLAMILSRGGNG